MKKGAEIDYLSFVTKVNEDPSKLFLGNEKKTQSTLRSMLQHSFQTQSLKDKKIVFDNFGLDQVWSQIVHHTEGMNRKTLSKLEQLTLDEEFLQ